MSGYDDSAYDDNPFADPSVSEADTAPMMGGAPKAAAVPAAAPVAAAPAAAAEEAGTPSWVSDAPTPSQSARGTDPSPGWADNNAGARPPAPSAASAPAGPVDEKVKTYIMYTRIANMILAVAMSMAAVIAMIASQDVSTGVIGLYILCFSCIICCFETHLKQVIVIIAGNCGFMFSAKSRACFFSLVGILMFQLSLFGMICGAAMLANAGFNIYILFKFPNFDEIQRQDVQSEIQDFLRSHPEYAEQAVAAGVSYARDNPDVVKQAAEAYVAPQPDANRPGSSSYV